MILCIRCSEETKDQLAFIAEKGNYRDQAEAIAVAVSNLAALHEEMGANTAMLVPSRSAPTSPVESGITASTVGRSGAPKQPHIPELLELRPDLLRPESLPVVSGGASDVAGTITIDQWIFGQCNRLLPVKVSCRALANVTVGEELPSVSTEDVAARIALVAAEFAEYLSQLDEQLSLQRWNRLATGFPKTGRNPEKSLRRYATQFVAAANRQGQLSGLPFALKFVAAADPSGNTIVLTRAGFDFSAQPNPLLDEGLADPDQKFSDAEVAFLLDHIARSVPEEHGAFTVLLRGILEGANTPDLLDGAMLKVTPEAVQKRVSKSFLSSQRSGAISRMTDLGLVVRDVAGTRISYAVTRYGLDYLEGAGVREGAPREVGDG